MKNLFAMLVVAASLMSVAWGWRGGGGWRGGPRPGFGYHNPGFTLGRPPVAGWRGERRYFGGSYYSVWAWGPAAPFWGWGPYYGWRLGLGWYIPEGLRCYATSTVYPGEWSGQTVYYSSDDAIGSALEACAMATAGGSENCRIRTCVRW